jgi:hypothetical protein
MANHEPDETYEQNDPVMGLGRGVPVSLTTEQRVKRLETIVATAIIVLVVVELVHSVWIIQLVARFAVTR